MWFLPKPSEVEQDQPLCTQCSVVCAQEPRWGLDYEAETSKRGPEQGASKGGTQDQTDRRIWCKDQVTSLPAKPLEGHHMPQLRSKTRGVWE